MEEEKDEIREEKNQKALTIKEFSFIIVIVVIVLLVFNSTRVKDFLFETYYALVVSNNEYIEEDYDNYNYEYSESNAFKDYAERLECFNLKISKNEDSNIFAVLESTSDIPLTDIKLYIILYDGDKKPIYVDTEYIDCILPGGKWAGELYRVNPNYETYDFLIEAGNYNVEETVNLFKNLYINQVFGTDTNMSVRFDNKNNKKVSAGVSAIYYDKNGNICDIERFNVFDLKPKKIQDVESYRYLDFQKKENSGVEIVLTSIYAD